MNESIFFWRWRLFATTLGAALLLCFSSLASAIAISGDGSLGDFTGTLTYSSASPGTTGQLVVTLNNTSDPLNGGFITGFGLNNPGGISSIDSFTTTNSTFGLLGLTTNGLDGQPFGAFDFGACTPTNSTPPPPSCTLLANGSPTGGIGVGSNATFTFDFGGTGLNLLTAQSFLDALSDTPQGGGAAGMLVRFRGFDDGGSDKVTTSSSSGDPSSTGTTIPEPSSVALVLLGLSLLGAGFAARRKA